jgi:hypothetical protein
LKGQAARQIGKLPGTRARMNSATAVQFIYRPGQLVYRKQMVKGRKLGPKWLGPYPVVQKVSYLVYKIRIANRDVSLNVEELKLCRAYRKQLH